MKNKFQKFAAMALGVVAVAAAMNACQDPGIDPAKKPSNEVSAKPTTFVGPSGATECTVTNIAANRTWYRDTVYLLRGDVRVTNGATLTIQDGTLVRGDSASRATLTITRGARINAIGLPNSPIIFTSADSIGKRQPRDWGGVVICGNASTNQTGLQNVEGFPACVTAPTYGGSVDNENSGTLQYVRIEYGGIPLPPPATNTEKNGLTLAGVGSGTTIDHVQVSFGADDGFEWFGGAVNCKYLISHRNLDDDFDSDFGYKGFVQYGVAVRDPQLADISGSNGFESDTDGDGVNATRTTGVFSNFTLVGPYSPVKCAITDAHADFNDGLHLRRNTGIDVHNTVIAGWQRHQFFADPANVTSAVVASYITAARPAPVVAAGTACVNQPVAPNDVWTTGPSNSCNDATVCSGTTGDATNGGLARVSGVRTNAWRLTNVDFAPIANSVGFTSPILATGTDATVLDGALTFFTANTTTASATTYFRGARRIADDNGWGLTSGWVNWNPDTQAYENDGQYD